jgi:dihydrofolate synthase/folylpolyglutamate synthase
MDYNQSITYLYSLGHEVLAAKFGLQNIRTLLDRLDHPEHLYRTVVVAGTNGKGSVAAMIEAVARAAGHRTALFTSPHLLRVEERIKVAGREISADNFAFLATRVRSSAEALLDEGKLLSPPTFFEQVTAIALCYFRDCGVELAILEVGLGGRLDATNVVDSTVSVVTSIDLDHQNVLGDTITEIAGEKAAIIKSGGRAVIGRQQYDAASEVLMDRCLSVNVLPVFANEPENITVGDFGRVTFDYESAHANYSRIMLRLRGRHQAENAAAAVEAAELLAEAGFAISREAIIKGLREVKWPGRLELIDERPFILYDGAHNPGGARALRAYLDEFWLGKVTLVFGVMGDKDIDAIASELFGAATTIVLTRLNDRRAADNARMGRAALGSSSNVIFTESVRQAMSWAQSVTPRDGVICVAGSLYLVGEVKQLMEDQDQQVGNRM